MSATKDVPTTRILPSEHEVYETGIISSVLFDASLLDNLLSLNIVQRNMIMGPSRIDKLLTKLYFQFILFVIFISIYNKTTNNNVQHNEI